MSTTQKPVELPVQELNYQPELWEKIVTLAGLELSVFLRGESGTGKTTVAEILHQQSNRMGKPFLPINCASLPETLIEAELFGTMRGAYTGATDRPGLFEQAKGGTLFLDEIGEFSVSLQAKLLKVLETKSVRRIGGMREIPCDFRLIAATHQDLSVFREDFRYRIDQAVIYLPPLRQSTEEEFNELWRTTLKRETGRCGCQLEYDRDVVEFLSTLQFPGNYREFGNTVLKIVLECFIHKQKRITLELVRKVLATTSGEAYAAPQITATPALSLVSGNTGNGNGNGNGSGTIEKPPAPVPDSLAQSLASHFWETGKNFKEFTDELFLVYYDFLTGEEGFSHERACSTLGVDRTHTYKKLKKLNRTPARTEIANAA